VGGFDRRALFPDDQHAVAHLGLAAAGKFFEGMVVFTTGVAAPSGLTHIS
jgi:hypothetical protein